MTDAELTRLAFKAAFSGADINHDKDMLKRWSPLTDDGDALRLAVKLGFYVGPQSVEVWRDGKQLLNIFEDDTDAYAATRRAIVRAAAAIGETL